MLKSILKFTATLAIASTTLFSQADPINAEGNITETTGVLGSLVQIGEIFTTDFIFEESLKSGKVILSGFCFNSDISGSPPSSATCPVDKSFVPILAKGQTIYTGEPPAPDAVFEQSGTTFDGRSGLLNLLAYSPSFGLNIAIEVTFNEDGTGSMVADAGLLGTAAGEFEWEPPVIIVPVPAAVWLFSSALASLLVMHKRRRKKILAEG